MALNFKNTSIARALPQHNPAHTANPFQPALHRGNVENPIPAGDFHQQRLRSAHPVLQVVDRICGYQFSLVDDEHLLAGLLHFGQDVRAQNDGVVAGQTLDEIASLVDLFRVQSGSGLVQNQHIRIVNDRLRQADPLSISLRKLAQ